MIRLAATLILALLTRDSALTSPSPGTARCQYRGVLQDSVCTPGTVETSDRAVVCGQPTRERRHVTESVKRAVFEAYGVSWKERSFYEVDHLVPLELGGSNAVSNLWPQPGWPLLGAHEKDLVEDYLHREVCAGRIPLERAQREIASDWTAVYDRVPKKSVRTE